MEGIVTRFIIEVMGKPPQIVEQTLKEVSKTISKRFKIIHEEYSKAEPAEGSDLFSAFIEVEFKVKGFEELFLAVIDFGPTVVEVIEPGEIKVSNTELQSALSELVSKFHLLSKALQVLKLENIKLKNTTKK